jgi:hypothetical protein
MRMTLSLAFNIAGGARHSYLDCGGNDDGKDDGRDVKWLSQFSSPYEFVKTSNDVALQIHAATAHLMPTGSLPRYHSRHQNYGKP